MPRGKSGEVSKAVCIRLAGGFRSAGDDAIKEKHAKLFGELERLGERKTRESGFSDDALAKEINALSKTHKLGFEISPQEISQYRSKAGGSGGKRRKGALNADELKALAVFVREQGGLEEVEKSIAALERIEDEFGNVERVREGMATLASFQMS